MGRAVLPLAAVCLVSMAAPAWAQDNRGDGPAAFSATTSGASFGVLPSTYAGAIEGGANRFTNFRFEVHLDLGWYGAGGIGVRFELPLARNGILDGVDDEIALSFGAELFYFYNPRYSGVFGLTPILAVQWNFFITPNISLFPELGVAFFVLDSRAYAWGTFIAPYLGFGFRYHFTDRNALLLRASWPAGFQIGITF